MFYPPCKAIRHALVCSLACIMCLARDQLRPVVAKQHERMTPPHPQGRAPASANKNAAFPVAPSALVRRAAKRGRGPKGSITASAKDGTDYALSIMDETDLDIIGPLYAMNPEQTTEEKAARIAGVEAGMNIKTADKIMHPIQDNVQERFVGALGTVAGDFQRLGKPLTTAARVVGRIGQEVAEAIVPLARAIVHHVTRHVAKGAQHVHKAAKSIARALKPLRRKLNPKNLWLRTQRSNQTLPGISGQGEQSLASITGRRAGVARHQVAFNGTALNGLSSGQYAGAIQSEMKKSYIEAGHNVREELKQQEKAQNKSLDLKIERLFATKAEAQNQLRRMQRKATRDPPATVGSPALAKQTMVVIDSAATVLQKQEKDSREIIGSKHAGVNEFVSKVDSRLEDQMGQLELQISNELQKTGKVHLSKFAA